MSDNYAVINGKRVELTDEQVAALGIKRVNPFERVESNEYYYYVRADGRVDVYTNADDMVDKAIYAACNHFTDEAFAKQVALHQLLYRKLLKFAYDNAAEDVEWNNRNNHWHIFYNYDDECFDIQRNDGFKYQSVYFASPSAAEKAIENVVMPFLKEHPDFVW